MIFINRNGLRWREAPKNTAGGADPKPKFVDATYPKAPTPGLQPAQQRGRSRQIGRTKGGMNTWLRAATDAKFRPGRFDMPAGQVSDYTGPAGQPAEGGLVAGRSGP